LAMRITTTGAYRFGWRTLTVSTVKWYSRLKARSRARRVDGGRLGNRCRGSACAAARMSLRHRAYVFAKWLRADSGGAGCVVLSPHAAGIAPKSSAAASMTTRFLQPSKVISCGSMTSGRHGPRTTSGQLLREIRFRAGMLKQRSAASRRAAASRHSGLHLLDAATAGLVHAGRSCVGRSAQPAHMEDQSPSSHSSPRRLHQARRSEEVSRPGPSLRGVSSAEPHGGVVPHRRNRIDCPDDR
jgi:hypothetical protein